MLSRKAGYIRYAEQRQEAVPADRNFSGLILRTLSVVGLICFFLLTYIALSAAKTDYGYALMNEKRQVQALQRVCQKGCHDQKLQSDQGGTPVFIPPRLPFRGF